MRWLGQSLYYYLKVRKKEKNQSILRNLATYKD